MRYLNTRFAVNVAFTLVLALGAGLLQAEGIRLSEPVAEDADSETFGEAMSRAEEGLPTLSLAQVVSQADELAGQQVAVNTRVAQVCQKKGCFFVAQEGAAALRVSFKDYGFFVPTDIAGRTVTLVGELVRKRRDAAEAAHLQDDAGVDAASLRAGEVYEIVASSVRVPRG